MIRFGRMVHARAWVSQALGTMAAAAIVLMLPASAAAVDRHATTSTFASTFAAAQGGDTVYLAAGSYGTWQGGAKTSPGVRIGIPGG